GGYSYSYYEDGKLVRKLQYTSDDSILLEEEYDTAGNYSLSKYFYDESEKYIGREDYYNNQIIYKFELRNNIIFHYTYESSDTFYVVGTNPETVEEGWFKSGEWETYIFYDFPKDGWYSKSEYVLGDGNNNNHTTYFYDETGSLVYEMVIVNEEKVSEMVHNQEKYSSINWDEY
ncbi:MAG: hypothetical protein IJ274_06365, partial [Lachnospiraceae bacterium]|nr:hypothetical protein [Lachnospiraceae bacterium]